MPSSYISMLEARARQELEHLTISQQRAIIEAYNSAGKELVRRYKKSGNGTATKALLAEYTRKIARETEELINEYAIKGARIAPSVEKTIMQEAFKRAGLDQSTLGDKFENMIGTLGKESVKNVIGGKIYKDGMGLSDRIWASSAMSSNKIQEIITAGLAQDMSAVKLSKMLQDYVNPAARKTWTSQKIRDTLGSSYAKWNGNLEYNALRLARTTLAHTATMSMRQAKKVNPYATKIKWHSVHAAGRTCSICNDMDGNIYDTDKCPFDHPNGMCYQTHEMDKSLNEIADELAAWCKGEENERLDNWWKSIGGKDEDKPKVLLNINYLTNNLRVLKNNMTRGFTQERYERFIKNLDRCSDEYKQMWLTHGNSLTKGKQEGTDAYYSPWQRKICINFKHEIEQARMRDYGEYSTFAHEFGHHVDNMLGDVSASKEFLDAMEKDRKYILNTYCKTGLDKDFLKMDLYENYGDCSKGVQDVMGGLKIDKFRWGHSEAYWNRTDRTKESASELFANISGSYMNEDEIEVMRKYFPNATKQFEKIITDGAKK